MNLVDLQTLAGISALTALATEAVKIMLDKAGFNYVSNIIAAIISVILSIAIVIVYPYVNGGQITAQVVYSGVATAFCAVLVSNLSYDKVVETLKALKES